jgi:hypothetical protein
VEDSAKRISPGQPRGVDYCSQIGFSATAHLALHPLVTLRWMTLGLSARSLTLLAASLLPEKSQNVHN